MLSMFTQKSKRKFCLFLDEKPNWNGRNGIIKYQNEDHKGNNLAAETLMLTQCF